MNTLSLTRILAALSLFAFLALVTVDANATVRHVPADYPTIQQAINAAVDGDTVLVASGSYVENINFAGKAITLTSENGPAVTSIDGNQAGPVIKFISGEGRSSILSGFTIKNGLESFFGGGIQVGNSSPIISGNIITNNRAAAGDGIVVDGLSASPLIQDNLITGNSMSPFISGGPGGGGILVLGGGHPQIIRNTISNNDSGNGVGGGGISIFGGGTTLILSNRILNNIADPSRQGGETSGGGIYISTYSPQVVVQNLVAHNFASVAGGGISLTGVLDSNFGVTLINNTIVDNDAPNGSGLYAAAFITNQFINNIISAKAGQIAYYCVEINAGITGSFSHNNVFSPGGIAYGGTCPDQTGMNGNISVDPLFVNLAGGDYHLQPSSLVIDKGDNSAPNLPVTDLDGRLRIQDGNHDGASVVDIGAFELPAPYSLCIQDDSSGNLLQINTTTGEYQFTNCSGLTVGGTGLLTRRGSLITLQHNASDRRITATIDTATNRATASIQLFSQGRTFSITDRNITNNTCSCK